MQFLKQQKRSDQPKALSKSRLREKQREDREMERVSTFFLPPRADTDNHKSRHRGLGTHHDRLDFQRLSRQFGSENSQELSKSPTSNHHICPKSYQISRDEASGTPSVDFHGYTGDKQGSDINTTYFTWSTSRYSPRGNMREDRTSPSIPGSVWTSTPEPIRKEIIATGVFRDTGIPAYDDRCTKQGTRRRIETIPADSHLDLHHESDQTPKVRYRDQAVMTDDPSNRSDRPRRNSSTPERRHENGVESAPLNNQTREDHLIPRSQAGPSPQASFGTQQVDRQQIAREIRLAPIEKSQPEQSTQTPKMQSTQASFTHQSPKLVDTQANQPQEKQTQETSDRASVNSRDAMPPPPTPVRTNHTVPTAYVNSNVNSKDVRQSNPSTNAAPAMLQRSLAGGHDSAVQDTHETTQRRDTIAPSLESSSSAQRILPPFDTLTWLPQRVPSARIIESRSIPSRPSTNPPISVNQPEGNVRGDSYGQISVSKSHVPESMAEFIARIEGESQLQSQAQDYDLEPGLSQDETSLNTHSFDTKLFHEQPADYCMEEETHSRPIGNLSFPYPNSGEAVIEQQAEDSYAEAQYPQHGGGSSRVFGSVAQPVGDFEEHSEMIGFWRPNQFSWF